MYHGSKSALLEVYDSTPSCIPTIKSNAIVIDFSTIINSQACITRAKTFEDLSDEIIDCVQNISVRCSRVDIVCDNYFKESFVVVVVGNFTHSQQQLQYRRIFRRIS